MKRNRHKQRPKFLNAPEPVGLAAELPDLLCDLSEDMRRELPSELLKAEWKRECNHASRS